MKAVPMAMGEVVRKEASLLQAFLVTFVARQTAEPS